MTGEYTAPPWFVSADGFEIRAKVHDCPLPCSAVIAEMIDKQIDSDEAMENARRIIAAVNATRDFTLAGLEEIAAKGLTLELGLVASLLVENGRAGERAQAKALIERLTPVPFEPPDLSTFDGVKQFLGSTRTAENTNDEQADAAYPLSRGD